MSSKTLNVLAPVALASLLATSQRFPRRRGALGSATNLVHGSTRTSFTPWPPPVYAILIGALFFRGHMMEFAVVGLVLLAIGNYQQIIALIPGL